jgi:hypothetical protein
MAGSKTQTLEARLPEMQKQKDFYGLIARELDSAAVLTASLSGIVTPTSLMDRLTTDFGRQLVKFINPRA